MVQVRVLGVALDPALQHIVLLKPIHDEPDTDRVLPIWIGTQEATSIAIAVEGAQAPRPLTHDLLATLIDTLGTRVDRVEVTRIDDGTFYAEITLTTPAGSLVLDARPSDAIALAVRTEASIWVADEVLVEAGIPSEMVDFDGDEGGDEGGSAEGDQAKLDEFKRFLERVDPEDFQG